MTSSPDRFAAISIVARGVFIELIRKKEFHVLSILMGVYFLAVLVVSFVGIESAPTATFLLNLGLTLAWGFSHLLVILLTVRQIPDDIEQRTLYPLLSRPIDRSTYLFGKYAACTLAGMITYVLFWALAWLPTPKMESYSGLLLAQTVLFQFLSLGLAAAIAISLSLVSPKPVAIVLLTMLVALSDRIVNFLENLLSKFLPQGLANWLVHYLPNFSDFHLSTRLTDGIAPLAGQEFVGLIFVAIVFSSFFLACGQLLFQRRQL